MRCVPSLNDREVSVELAVNSLAVRDLKARGLVVDGNSKMGRWMLPAVHLNPHAFDFVQQQLHGLVCVSGGARG